MLATNTCIQDLIMAELWKGEGAEGQVKWQSAMQFTPSTSSSASPGLGAGSATSSSFIPGSYGEQFFSCIAP